ncbi:hypothetical protein ACRTDJ_11865 [Shewanella algae]
MDELTLTEFILIRGPEIIYWVFTGLGAIATLYMIGFFLYSGVTIFDNGQKKEMPFRYKVSYVLVVAALMPYFYIVFIKELLLMWSQYRQASWSPVSA